MPGEPDFHETFARTCELAGLELPDASRLEAHRAELASLLSRVEALFDSSPAQPSAAPDERAARDDSPGDRRRSERADVPRQETPRGSALPHADADTGLCRLPPLRRPSEAPR
jgi:hypothetical protein